MRWTLVAMVLGVFVAGSALAQRTMGDDPEAAVKMARAMLDLGIAQAIEAACPGHVKTLDVEIDMIAAAATLGADATLALVRKAMDEAARDFRMREDRVGFCGRILAAHGPGSRRPLVRHGTPAR